MVSWRHRNVDEFWLDLFPRTFWELSTEAFEQIKLHSSRRAWLARLRSPTETPKKNPPVSQEMLTSHQKQQQKEIPDRVF